MTGKQFFRGGTMIFFKDLKHKTDHSALDYLGDGKIWPDTRIEIDPPMQLKANTPGITLDKPFPIEHIMKGKSEIKIQSYPFWEGSISIDRQNRLTVTNAKIKTSI